MQVQFLKYAWKRIVRKSIFFSALFWLLPSCLFATDRVSTGSTAWGSGSTWSPAGIPVAGDNITILAGHNVTMGSNPGACNNLTINGNLGCSNNRTLNAAGDLVINNGGSLNGGTGTLNVTGTFTVPAGASVSIGAVRLVVGGATSISGNITIASTTGTKSFGAVTLNSGGIWLSSVAEPISITGALTINGDFNCGSGPYTVSGNMAVGAGTTNFEGSVGGSLTVASSATVNVSTGNCSVTGLTSVSGKMNLSTTTGNKLFGNIIINSGGIWTSTVAENVTVTGSITSSGTFDCFSGTYATSGNLLVSAGTTNYEGSVGGTCTVSSGAILAFPTGIFSVTGATSVTGTVMISTATGTKTFGDVTVNSGGVWNCTVAEAITINGSVSNSGTFTANTGIHTLAGTGKTIAGTLSIPNTTITGTYTNNGTLTVGTSLAGAGALTQGSNSTLNIGGTSGITTLNATANTPNTVVYNGAGAQTLKNITYNNLTITSGNTVTAPASITCNGNLSITSGTLASSTFSVTVSGSTSISGGTMNTSAAGGAFRLQSLSMTGGTINGTVTGNVTAATTFTVPSGSPTIGRGNLTVTGATSITGSLTFNNLNGAKTFGDVTVNTGGAWNSSVALGFTINGNLANSGTFTANTGTYTLAGASKTISGTLSIPTISVTGSYTNNADLTFTTALQGAGTFAQGATGTLNANGATFTVTTFNASASGNTVSYGRVGAQNIRVPTDGSYHHLTIAGSGNKTLLAATDINGNLTISGTLVASGFGITLAGDWTNTGTFTPGTNTVTLDGAAQTITKSGGETFNHLAVAGTGIKTLGDAITTTGDLTISSTLDVSASDFGVAVMGNWINNGTFVYHTGTVTFNGTSAQTIGGTTTGSFYNITQSNAAGVALARAQNLYNVLTVSSGTFTTTGFNFTLVSDINGTASIAALPSGANVAGNIIMQRYVDSGPTDWRFFSSAVSGATIADWADDFATSGFTGSTDPSNSFVSIYTYDETVTGISDNGFVPATNVTNSISNGKGFWVYLGPTPLTYEVTGPPNTFTVTPSVTFTSSAGADHDGWNLVANPYPSAIDWDDPNWTKTNMDDAIYVYNSSTGSFASYVSGIGINGGSNYIASQQAFWVKANAPSPVLRMVENVKTAQNPLYLKQPYSPNASHYPMAFKDFPIPLNVNTIPNSIKLTAVGNGHEDETLIRFAQGGTSGFDAGSDAWKMLNVNTACPNLSSVINDSVDLSINTYNELASHMVIPVRLRVGASGNYSIKRDSLLMLPMSSCVILEDILTGTFTDLRSTVSYSFSISDTTKAPRFILHVYAPVSKQAISEHCAGDTSGMAIATGTGNGPWDYVWKDASGNVKRSALALTTSDTLKNLSAGVYTVEVSGSACGVVTDTVEVKAASQVAVTVNYSDVQCNGQNNGSAYVTVAGGNAPFTYVWSNGQTSSAVNNLSPGNYSVTVSDAGGCSQTQWAIISQPSVLVAGFAASADTINLQTGNMVLFTNSSSGSTARQWDFGDGTPADTSDNPVHIYSAVGNYKVKLLVTNGYCNDSASRNVVVIDSVNTAGVPVITNSSSFSVLYGDGEVLMLFDLPGSRNVDLSVYNMIGEKVYARQMKNVKQDMIQLNVADRSPGMYVITAKMSDAMFVRKVIIKK